MSCGFEDAYRKARKRYSDAQWDDLNLRNQSEAIYQEMRLLDAVTAASAVKQQVPILPDHRRPKIGMRGAGDEVETGSLVDGAGGNQDIVGP
jgi:hypothetical protein